MNAAPQPNDAPQPSQMPEPFRPEEIFDLLHPIEAIVAGLHHQFPRQDLQPAEVRSMFIIAVDKVLLDREPWAFAVPAAIRQSLIARVMRCHWPYSAPPAGGASTNKGILPPMGTPNDIG